MLVSIQDLRSIQERCEIGELVQKRLYPGRDALDEDGAEAGADGD